MRIFHKHVLASLMALLFIVSSNANATIFVPDFGDTGVQTYNYTFANDYVGNVTIGVSNVGDEIVLSSLEFPGWGGATIVSNGPADTSMYFNDYGEAGTNGMVTVFAVDLDAGETLSFDWRFFTDDYSPFHDFAFIQIGAYYDVLAQIRAVPVPAAVWLFGSGLLGLIGMRKRQQVAA